ncbi:hypothetical protein LTR56_026596 [Elasticomyces elasticus]|nr:hypothetical protein LTR56_026596 [Elasticomyces elasticus]KAK3617631.1 hypothetical protein LTR22_026675 [Elasticomyces elasticus]KAK4901403.1 hypothetical protein LTR49_027295 [Elasticomyces elasticus]KAK5736169.1 hypothetical protein LTS12_026264 [Elasticomyces elasticus]
MCISSKTPGIAGMLERVKGYCRSDGAKIMVISSTVSGIRKMFHGLLASSYSAQPPRIQHLYAYKFALQLSLDFTSIPLVQSSDQTHISSPTTSYRQSTATWTKPNKIWRRRRTLSNEAEASSIIGRLENVADAITDTITDTNTNEVRDYIVKQLSNFLLFVLSVDYQCNTSTSLRWIDREHFATINNTLLCLRTVHNHQPFSAEERAEYCAGMGTFLEEPCKALAIPIEHVAKTILDYFKYQNHAGAYQGSVHELYRSCGADALAQKIMRDSQVLIPRLVSSTDMADEMCDALYRVSNKYFKHIAGTESSTIGSSSGKGKGCTVVQSGKYTLSERGEAYEAARARTEAKRRQQRGLSSKHWASRLTACLKWTTDKSGQPYENASPGLTRRGIAYPGFIRDGLSN